MSWRHQHTKRIVAQATRTNMGHRAGIVTGMMANIRSMWMGRRAGGGG